MSLQIPAMQRSETTKQDGELVLRSQMGGWNTTSYPAQPWPNLSCFLIYKSWTVHTASRVPGTCKGRIFLHRGGDLTASRATLCISELTWYLQTLLVPP